jgi:hypothetical protein
MTHVTVDVETLVNEFIEAFQHAVFQATPDDKKDAVLTWASEFLDDPTKDRFLALLEDPRFQEVISLIADQYAIQDSAFRIKTDELIKASSSNPTLPPLQEASESQQSSRRGTVSLSSANIGRKQLLFIIGMIVLALLAAGVYFLVIRDGDSFTSSQQEIVAVEPTFPPASTTSPVEPVPAESQAESGSTLFAPATSTTCEYMVEQRLPADINVMLYKSLDFSSEGTVGPIPYQYYYIHKLGNGTDALMVIYENRIAYAPSSSFPTAATPECADGQTQIAPKVQLSSLLVGKWRWIATGSIIILLLSAVAESFLKKRRFALLLFIIGMWTITTWVPYLELSQEYLFQHFIRLLVLGLVLVIGLGGRENTIETRESMNRTMAEARISEEVDELTKFDPGIRGLFDRFDWSYMSIFGGIQEALSLTLSGSFLTILWGFNGFLLAVIIANLGLLFEALRRNKKGDWGVFIGTSVGGVLIGILTYILPHGSNTQAIALLLAFVVGFIALMGLGLSNVSPIAKDRVPEGVYGMVVNFLATLAILVQAFPQFNGINL